MEMKRGAWSLLFFLMLAWLLQSLHNEGVMVLRAVAASTIVHYLSVEYLYP